MGAASGFDFQADWGSVTTHWVLVEKRRECNRYARAGELGCTVMITSGAEDISALRNWVCIAKWCLVSLWPRI